MHAEEECEVPVPIWCAFHGHTAVQGLATRMADGSYRPAVRIITMVNGVRSERQPDVPGTSFPTYGQAARFGLAFGERTISKR